MKLKCALLMLAVIAAETIPSGDAMSDGNPAVNVIARTPPMGWHPWNTFGEQQDERLIKEIADSMVSKGMKDAGYQFVGPDCGWASYLVDSGGILHPRPDRFPSGPKALADYVHGLGFKEVAYSDVVPSGCCGIGLTPDAYEKNALQWAEWGADYLKLDYCGADTARNAAIMYYTRMREALKATGRPILYSICEWGHAQNRKPWEWADTIGNMWRTTRDINPGNGLANWADLIEGCNGVLNCATENNLHWRVAGPGKWNDPDMLCVGLKNLSTSENRSHFSLWCIMAAPLIAGNDVRTMSDTVKEILTNIEAIAIDQDPLGIQGHVLRGDVKEKDSVSIWAGKPLFDGSNAVLVLNSRRTTVAANVRWSDVGIDTSKALYVRDLWKHTTTGPHRGGVLITVPAHDARMLRLCEKSLFPIPPIVVASKYAASFHLVTANVQKQADTIFVTNKGTEELPPWEISRDLPPWLSVTVRKLSSRVQALITTVSASGLTAGRYHTIVRAHNREPVSHMSMSALWYDVEMNLAAGEK